jgi:hypothetical protein
MTPTKIIVITVVGRTDGNIKDIRSMNLTSGAWGQSLPLEHLTMDSNIDKRCFTHFGDTLHMVVNRNFHVTDSTTRLLTFDTTGDSMVAIEPSVDLGDIKIQIMQRWGPYLVLKPSKTSSLCLYDASTMTLLADLPLAVSFVGQRSITLFMFDSGDDLFVLPETPWRRDRHWWICAQVRRIVQTVMLMRSRRPESGWGLLSRDLVVGCILPLLVQRPMLVACVMNAAVEHTFVWNLPENGLLLNDLDAPLAGGRARRRRK